MKDLCRNWLPAVALWKTPRRFNTYFVHCFIQEFETLDIDWFSNDRLIVTDVSGHCGMLVDAGFQMTGSIVTSGMIRRRNNSDSENLTHKRKRPTRRDYVETAEPRLNRDNRAGLQYKNALSARQYGKCQRHGVRKTAVRGSAILCEDDYTENLLEVIVNLLGKKLTEEDMTGLFQQLDFSTMQAREALRNATPWQMSNRFWKLLLRHWATLAPSCSTALITMACNAFDSIFYTEKAPEQRVLSAAGVVDIGEIIFAREKRDSVGTSLVFDGMRFDVTLKIQSGYDDPYYDRDGVSVVVEMGGAYDDLYFQNTSVMSFTKMKLRLSSTEVICDCRGGR